MTTRSLKSIFMNLDIRRKAAVAMMVGAVAASVLVGGGCYVFFSSMFKTQHERQTTETMETSVDYLKDTIGKLYRSVTYNLAADVFKRAYDRIVDPRSNIPFPNLYIDMQAGIDALKRSSELIDSVAILGRNGEFFSSYEIGFRDDGRLLSIWGTGIAETIRWIPARTNPFFPGSPDVVTVQFPVSYSPGLYLSSDRVMMLAVLLDARKLNQALERMNKTTSSLFYLADSSGYPLSISKDEGFFDIVSSDRFRKKVRDSSGRSFFDYAFEGSRFKVATADLGISDLRVVSFVSEKTLDAGKRKILLLTLSLLLAGGLIALLISTLLARSITGPIYRLVGKVRRIEAGDYDAPRVTVYEDEMCDLDESIGTMAATIKTQLDRIRTETRLKRKAEIDALSEQVNPHFLYNTLDVIRWEVLAGNSETASAMIEDLGDFLRTGLNYGAEYVSVEEEFRHVEKYVRLMNHRMDRQVRFLSRIAPDCAQIPILKLLLQPLAENALRHGFPPRPAADAYDPLIVVSADKDAYGWITVAVEDNGGGFDAEELARLSENQPKGERKGHVGLSNVRTRLSYAYGPNASITFESTPFVRNRIALRLPPAPPWTPLVNSA